jgi:UDP-N-acetylglucosamine 2-epimerase (non-hydrolysing)
MRKLKVVTVVGTRPELIRLSRLIPKLDKFTNHVFVHTGQNYDRELSEVFFKDLGIRQPDHFFRVDTASFGSAMADTIRKSEALFLQEKPDAVMVLGDTNSAIAAIVAERLHIPVYHMEAGNRSFDRNVPEELNRRIIDHASTFNLPYNEYARQNLLAEGLHPKSIFKTGSPIREVLNFYRDKINGSTILDELQLSKNGFFLVSLHRQENVDSPSRLEGIFESLVEVIEHFEIPAIVSTHPRTRSRLSKSILNRSTRITFHKPFGYLDYNKLQMNAKCVISDSGTTSEEAALLGVPAVIPRDWIERPEGLDTGFVTTAQIGRSAPNLLPHVLAATELELGLTLPDGYEVLDFSNRVLKVLLSTSHLASKS